MNLGELASGSLTVCSCRSIWASACCSPWTSGRDARQKTALKLLHIYSLAFCYLENDLLQNDDFLSPDHRQLDILATVHQRKRKKQSC